MGGQVGDFDRGGGGLGLARQVSVLAPDGSGTVGRHGVPVYPPDFTEITARLVHAFDGDVPAAKFFGRVEGVGAVLRHDTVCAGCGQAFTKGDVVTAELAPMMAGTFRHTDCEDPKLERAVGDDECGV